MEQEAIFDFEAKEFNSFSSFVSCRASVYPILISSYERFSSKKILMNGFYITIHNTSYSSHSFHIFMTIHHTNVLNNKLFILQTFCTTNYSTCLHFNLHFFRGVIIIRTQHTIPVVNGTTTIKTWPTVSRRVGDSVKFRISISPNRINFRSWWRHIWFLIETTFLNVNFEFYICPEYVLIDEHAVRFEL